MIIISIKYCFGLVPVRGLSSWESLYAHFFNASPIALLARTKCSIRGGGHFALLAFFCSADPFIKYSDPSPKWIGKLWPEFSLLQVLWWPNPRPKSCPSPWNGSKMARSWLRGSFPRFRSLAPSWEWTMCKQRITGSTSASSPWPPASRFSRLENWDLEVIHLNCGGGQVSKRSKVECCFLLFFRYPSQFILLVHWPNTAAWAFSLSQVCGLGQSYAKNNMDLGWLLLARKWSVSLTAAPISNQDIAHSFSSTK